MVRHLVCCGAYMGKLSLNLACFTSTFLHVLVSCSVLLSEGQVDVSQLHFLCTGSLKYDSCSLAQVESTNCMRQCESYVNQIAPPLQGHTETRALDQGPLPSSPPTRNKPLWASYLNQKPSSFQISRDKCLPSSRVCQRRNISRVVDWIMFRLHVQICMPLHANIYMLMLIFKYKYVFNFLPL